MRPKVLVLTRASATTMARLQAEFDVVHAPTPELFDEAVGSVGSEIRAVLTNGTAGFSAAQMDALPTVEIVLTHGAGHENVDLEAARQRKVRVATGGGVNAFAVADHAVALLLSTIRQIPAVNAAVHAGEWDSMRTPRPLALNKNLGIVGLGRVGENIADRLSGFRMTTRYHNRSPKPDSPHEYVGSVRELAAASDFLILSCPGGPATRRIVDAAVLGALGPSGYLVNVSRGTTVDTQALVEALHSGRIAGAALDVVEGEPNVPRELLDAPNLIITPHIGARAPESAQAAAERVVGNLKTYFSGEGSLVGQIV